MRNTITRPTFVKQSGNVYSNRKQIIKQNYNGNEREITVLIPAFNFCPIMGAIYYLKKITFKKGSL